MKVILYIGHHKVGSTALQVFLSQNSHRLLEAGILYPAVEMQGFAHMLAKATGQGDKRAYLPGNIREPHSALAYRMMADVSNRTVPPQYKMLPAPPQMMHAIRSQVAELQPKTLVLCSEVFANFGEVDPGLITRLRTAFPEAELQVYCAFRRPDQYLVAWHGQRLKVGERLAPLRETGHRDYAHTIHFNFRNVIEQWNTQLPEAELILRNYADILDAGGSPEDFMARTDAEWPERLLPAGKPNRSLPNAAVEILRRANLVLEMPQAHQFAQYMMQKTGGIVAEADDDVEMFRPEDRARMLEDFRPTDAYLGRLNGQDGFFPDLEDIARVHPIPELQAAAAFLKQLDPDAMPSPESARFVDDLKAEYRSLHP